MSKSIGSEELAIIKYSTSNSSTLKRNAPILQVFVSLVLLSLLSLFLSADIFTFKLLAYKSVMCYTVINIFANLILALLFMIILISKYGMVNFLYSYRTRSWLYLVLSVCFTQMLHFQAKSITYLNLQNYFIVYSLSFFMVTGILVYLCDVKITKSRLFFMGLFLAGLAIMWFDSKKLKVQQYSLSYAATSATFLIIFSIIVYILTQASVSLFPFIEIVAFTPMYNVLFSTFNLAFLEYNEFLYFENFKGKATLFFVAIFIRTLSVLLFLLFVKATNAITLTMIPPAVYFCFYIICLFAPKEVSIYMPYRPTILTLFSVIMCIIPIVYIIIKKPILSTQIFSKLNFYQRF